MRLMQLVAALLAWLNSSPHPTVPAAQTRVWVGDLVPVSTLDVGSQAGFREVSIIVAAPNGEVVIADRALSQIAQLDGTGRVKWRYLDKGVKAGQIRDIVDVLVDHTGNTMVLDPTLGRVNSISPDGKFLRLTRLPEPATKLLPSFRGTFTYIVPYDNHSVWAEIDFDGKVTNSNQLPLKVHFDAPIVGESFTAATNSGAVLAYRWAGSLVFFDAAGHVRGVNSGPSKGVFPLSKTYSPKGGNTITRVDPIAVPEVAGISAANGFVYVLTGEGAGGRSIDIYSEQTMTYVGSLHAPRSVKAFAVTGRNAIATIHEEFAPMIHVWRVRMTGVK